MIKFDADINISGNDSKITSAQLPESITNMQFSATINDIVNKKSKTIASSPFIFGSSILGEGDTFTDKVEYFVGSELSGANGHFQKPYKITVNGKNIITLRFVFDTLNNEYPKTIHLQERISSGLDDTIEGYTSTESVGFEGENFYDFGFRKEYGGKIVGFSIWSKSDNVVKTDISYNENRISGRLFAKQSNQKVFVRLFVKVKLTSGDIVCDSPYVTVDGLPGNDSATVTIEYWNKSNKPFKLQGIYVNNNIHIDGSNLISYEDSTTDRARINAPSYGIVSSSARLTFIDNNNDVMDMAKKKLLVSNLEMKAKIIDGKNKISQNLSTLYTDKWNFNADSKIVEVTFCDPLKRMQEVPITVINFDPVASPEYSMSAVFDFLRYETLNCGIPIITFQELPEAAKNILQKTIVPYLYFDEGSLWQKWNDFCEVNSLHLFWDVDRVNFTYGA